MDEKPDQIIEHIEARRDELGRNLSELENKVRRTTDWHTYYEKNPMMILGAVLGGGLLVGAAVGGRSKSRTKGINSSRGSLSSTGSAKYGSSSYGEPSSGTTGRSASSPSSNYYTPSETTASSFAGLGASTGAAAGSTPHTASSSHHSTTGTVKDTSGSSTEGTVSNITSKLQTLAGGQMHQVNEAFDHIRGALIAFGITKVKEFLSQSVPGLEQHLNQAAGQHDSGQHKPASSQTPGQSTSTPPGQHTSGMGTSSSGGGASDYRSGSQNQPGGTSTNPTSPSATNTGRASEADEYAGAGSRTSSPRQTP